MSLPENLWLHRFALLVAFATLILVTAGASVTSTGSGLAVPDWPLSFGTFFPPMVGGVLYEHGHRMIAGVVLALTLVLTIWLYRKEKRAWVRRLGAAAMAAVLVQALLGGLTVLLKLPTQVSVAHAGLAMAFFCLTVSITAFTSPNWQGTSLGPEVAFAAPRRLALVTTAIVYLQILLGAVVRHSGAGLAIPDFPLSYGRLVPPYFSPPIALHYAHRVGAVVVTVCVVLLVLRIARSFRGSTTLMQPVVWLVTLLGVQLLLGALTIWTHRAVVPTTAHVAVGALVLANSLILTLRAYHSGVALADRA